MSTMTTTTERKTSDTDTFVRDLEKRVRRLDEEFEQMIRKAESAELTVREKLTTMRTDFVGKRDELQRRLGEARMAGASAKAELASGLVSAWNELSDAFNSARAEFVRLA